MLPFHTQEKRKKNYTNKHTRKSFFMRSELLGYQFVPMHMDTVFQRPYVSSLCSFSSLSNMSRKKA